MNNNSSKKPVHKVNYFESYINSSLKHVHQLIAWGYDDARGMIQSNDEQEPAITGFITEAIQKRLSTINCPEWCNYYSVKEDPPINSTDAIGKHRPRVDIIIEANFEGRPQVMFEAKRLRRNDHNVGDYIGSEGMGCFISGKYAKNNNEAAMLGYIQSDSIEYWCEKLKEKIQTECIKLCLVESQNDISIINDFQNEWNSKHSRVNNRSILLYHILLDCCTDN